MRQPEPHENDPGESLTWIVLMGFLFPSGVCYVWVVVMVVAVLQVIVVAEQVVVS